MKFFTIVLFIALSNSLYPHLVYPYDIRDILASSHLLFDLYFKPQNKLPKNDVPNIFSQFRIFLLEKAQ